MSWFDQFNIGKLKPAVNPIPPPYNEGGAAPPPSSGGPETGVPTAPGATPPAAAWNPGTAPSGWDPVKWADQNHQTIKYKVGRILNKYPHNAAGVKQALPELEALGLGITFDGKDGLYIPSLGPKKIDVIQGASGPDGGVAWQWGDNNVEEPSAAANGLSNLPSNAAPPPGGWGGGAFGSAGGGGTGGWSMPKGSTYQFGGVPGFNTGVTGADTSGLVGGSRDRLGMDAGSGATTGAFGQSSSPTGSFGVGQIASSMPSTTPDPHSGATGHPATTTGGAFGSYDRAPSFTPMDPFAPPPSPDAAVSAGEKFVLPTGQAALDADPGYKFRLNQGLDALQNSASAKGLLRTGGTLKGLQDFGQQMASQEYQNAVDRAVQTYGLNEGTRRFDTGFNADQQQQKYKNTFDALNQRYAYANQQNLAGNSQALEGYKTDVGRELGRMGIQLTADQNAVVNGLNAQQQQWMQAYMMNGQSFDQAYKLLMANLQYPS